MTGLGLKLDERRLARRSGIEALEESLRSEIAAGNIEQTIHDGGTDEGHDQCDHAFGDGVYCRGLWIPAGTCVIGRIHKQARVVIIAAGACQFVDETQARTVQAPWMGEFAAGSKTAVYAYEDTYWAACLGVGSKDARGLFDELTVATHEEYRALLENREIIP